MSLPAEPAPAPRRRSRDDRSADLGLVIMAVIWGVNFAVVKVALRELDPMVFNTLRFPLACAFLYVVIRRRGPVPRPQAGDWPALLVLALLGTVAYQLLFVQGLARTLAGNASLLLTTSPVWTTLLSRLAGHERPGALAWVGVAGAFGGIALVVLGGRAAVALSASSMTGDLMILAAAVVWSLYTVRARALVHRYGPVVLTAWALWLGTVGLVAAGIPGLLRARFAAISWTAWGGVFYAGVMAIGIAYLLWNHGVARLGSSRTAIYVNLTPIVTLGTAWVWLGEVPTVWQLAGAAVVIASVLLTRRGQRAPAEA